MSVSSVASQSVFLNTPTSVTKNSDSSKIVSASLNTSDTSATSSVDATISTKWGFKVDENGFFGADFNKVAGIPANIKINQKQMETVEQYSKIVGSSDDPVTALGKVWSFFSKVAGSTLDSDGSMTIEQVAKMPFSYQIDGSLLNNPVSVQNSWDEMDKVNSAYSNIAAMSNNTLDNGLQGFFGGLTQWDPNGDQLKETYKALTGVEYDSNEPSGEVGVGELFGVFCNNALQPEKEYVDNVHSYYAFLQSGQDFKSYLTNKFGSDYMQKLTDAINTMPDGKVIPSMIDDLFKELDQSMKANYTSYLSSQNTIADSILSQNDNTTSTNSTLSSMYQGIKNVKSPSAGSLINIGI